ncbi:hypothetical protein CEE69_25120 [Rhodopirellula bahusiensis]|uniref:Ankryin n=2 Tax=Rhodopirellula bahusiensis TaxID=2014065 RepID=A0A2G1W0K5_9BACT|nr:hypothetical protein CEE69_25120 [Rhodopirellula bahusiensis]
MRKVESTMISRLEKGVSAEELGEILDHASSNGFAPVLECAISSGLLTESDEINYKLLRNASKFGHDHPKTVRLLLDLGVDPNDGIVMEYSGVQSLAVLAEYGGNIEGNRHNSLHVSIKERRKDDKALALIDLGVDVNFADPAGRTPLMYASAFGRKATFDALIAAGADPLRVDHTGRSALRYALESLCRNIPSFDGRRAHLLQNQAGAKSIARTLRDYLPAQPEDYVIVDAVLNDRKALKQKLESGLDPNTLFRGAIGDLDVMWDLVLRDAPSSDRKARMQQLVDDANDFRRQVKNAETLSKEFGQSTILMWAVLAESISVIKLLLDYNADPDLETENGLSACKLVAKLPLKEQIRDLIHGS